MKAALLLSPAVLLLAGPSCTSTSVYRLKNGSLTATHRSGEGKASYWIAGAPAGQLTTAEQMTVFRKDFITKPQRSVPVKCQGFIDATDPRRIEIRLAERQGGAVRQVLVNGRHKVTDENAPKPFYHWLIP